MTSPEYKDRGSLKCPYNNFHIANCAVPGCTSGSKMEEWNRCYITTDGKHIPFCEVHQQMEFIWCSTCFEVHSSRKICDLKERQQKILNQIQKLENLIKYLPGSPDYQHAQTRFQQLQESVNNLP